MRKGFLLLELGLPEFSDASVPACSGLMTPANLRPLVSAGALVLLSVYVDTQLNPAEVLLILNIFVHGDQGVKLCFR